MQDDVLNGYEKAEHYSSFVNLEEDLEANIRVFTVYGDSANSMDEEFQMIQYRFNRDVTRGLNQFREKSDEFTDYNFFPIINNQRGPTEMTLMINIEDRVEASDLAEHLIEKAHEDIGL